MLNNSVLIGALLMVLATTSGFADQARKEESGKEIVLDRNKGNCLACHGMPGVPEAEQTGTAGPPLIAMQARFPDRQVLRAKVWDPTVSNPATFMPPFGKHGVLTEKEIDKVVDFIYGL